MKIIDMVQYQGRQNVICFEAVQVSSLMKAVYGKEICEVIE